MITSEELNKEIYLIKERNVKVETDKAWEVSWTRRLFITVCTYLIAGVWLFMINDVLPLLKALVPAVGYLLSTMSLSFIKKLWFVYLKK